MKLYSLYFVDDETAESILMGEFDTIKEAEVFLEKDNSEGDEAILYNKDTGEELYYCPDGNNNWLAL